MCSGKIKRAISDAGGVIGGEWWSRRLIDINTHVTRHREGTYHWWRVRKCNMKEYRERNMQHSVGNEENRRGIAQTSWRRMLMEKEKA